MKQWQRLVGILVASVVLAGGVVSQTGCLTPAQRAAMVQYDQALEADAAEIAKLKAEAEKYKAELAAIVAKLKAGEMPKAEAAALVAKAVANYDATLERVASVEAKSAATKKAIEDMKKSEAPWWLYLVIGLPPALAVVSQFVPALSPIAAAAQAAKGQLVAANQKLAVTTEIAGSLSRTLDAVGDPAKKETAMVREQAADEAATKADYDRLRAEAKALLI